MKPSLPRLQILTGLLARPQEPPCQSGRKLAEYLTNDIGTADEFLARYGWRLRYAKARWLIYSTAAGESTATMFPLSSCSKSFARAF